MRKQIVLAALALLLVVPAATAGVKEDAQLTALALATPGAPGCAAPTSAVAALPGPVSAQANLTGCGLVLLAKPATSDVQFGIGGGNNTLSCSWRPLAVPGCAGAWTDHGNETLLRLRIMGGSPGAVTAFAQ